MKNFANCRRLGVHEVVLALIIALGPAPLIAQTAHCRAVGSNPYSKDLAYLRRLARSTDSSYIQARARIGMPQSDSTKIQNILNETVCAKMVKTMDSLQAHVDPARKVYLYKFANGWFAALDPNATTRMGVLSWYFYNNNSKYKGGYSLGGG